MAKNKTEIHVTTVFDGELDATDVFVSLIAQKHTRKTDKEYLASRLGGDEFALLISYDKNIEVNKIKQKITDVFSLINNLIKEKYGMEAGISMGVTFKTEKINSFDELYDKADTAMYERKRNGKDGVAFFK